MTPSQTSQFLRLDPQSLFSSQMKEISQAISSHYGCSHKICSKDELSAWEWSGLKPILGNLPQAYFGVSGVTILEWDDNNCFKKTEPQYWKVMGEVISAE